MKNILTVVKKELLRVLKDRRLLMTLILPGLLIYVIYSIMGGVFASENQQGGDNIYRVITVNLPAEIQTILDSGEFDFNINYIKLAGTDISQLADEKKELLKTLETDLIVAFDADFITKITANGATKPKVEIYYNSTDAASVYIYQAVNAALMLYEGAVLENRGIDTVVFNKSGTAVFDEKAAAAQGIAMLIPMLILSFLFSGSMAVAPDSIAGEKDRGTIATILITPIKRSHLALGKIIALSILATISALSSFVGLILSIPKLMGGADIGNLYGFGEYALLLLVLVSTVLFIIGIVSIVSTFAKSVREASMMLTPLTLLSLLIGLSTMINSLTAGSSLLYLIPLYNTAQVIASILTFNLNIINLIITVVSNVVYTAASVLLITKLFSNEKVMFSK